MKVKLRVKFQKAILTKYYGGPEGRGVPFSWRKEAMLGLTWFLGSLGPVLRSQLQVSPGSGVPHVPGPLNEGGTCFPRTLRKAQPPGLIPAVFQGEGLQGNAVTAETAGRARA